MNLDQQINLDIKAFWHWWSQELFNWLPERARQFIAGRRITLIISLSEQTLEIHKFSHDGVESILNTPVNTMTADLWLQQQELLADNERIAIILRLSEQQAISTVVYLPLAAKDSLNEAIAYEIDKYTPFSAEQIYYAICPLEMDNSEQLKLRLITVQRSLLEDLLKQLAQWQMKVDIVDYVAIPNHMGRNELYNLLPPLLRAVKKPWSQWLTLSLSGLCGLLLAGIFILPWWRESRAVEILQEELEQVEKEARIVKSGQLEIDLLMEETLHLVNIKNKSPRLVELLNRMTRLMPDDTWLMHLKYDKQQLQIQGQSPSASALISALDKDDMITQVRFVSPVTQDKNSGMERFQISMTILEKTLEHE
jgi:general secretion pathway protein L